MLFFVRNAVVFQILFLAVAYGWIDGGTRPDLLLPVVPWLAAFVLEMLLVFPQAKSIETLADARRRVWHSLSRDPLLYLSILLVVFLVIPFFNVAGAPYIDAATRKWVNPAPPVPFLPFCVNSVEHAVLLLWFPPVLISALAVRHALLKRGKRLLLKLFCWNGAGLAVLGFLQAATNAKSIYWGQDTFSYFFSTFGYPNFAGAFFTLLFVISLGIWFGEISAGVIGPQSGGDIRSREKKSFWKEYGMLIPSLLNLTAAFISLSRAAILLCIVCSVIYIAYMFSGIWQKTATSGRAQLVTALSVVLLLGALGLTILAPKGLKQELETITPSSVLDRVGGAGYHNRVGMEIFHDYPVYGVGGWGYPHYQVQHLTPEDLKHFQDVGGANVHNDFVQFLAELGWMGTGLLLLCVAAIVYPLVVELVRLSRSLAKNRTGETSIPHPKWLYRLPPEVLGIFLGCGATVLHSLGDLPFRNPAIVIVWLCAWPCASGFIPVVKQNR